MGFYDLNKKERTELVNQMKDEIEGEAKEQKYSSFLNYASDKDTYIRKKAYLILGRYYRDFPEGRDSVLNILEELFDHEDELVRQTLVNTLGEIGKNDAIPALKLMEHAMDDDHHKVRNAVMGSLKKMSEKNPVPTLNFAENYLCHPDAKIRRQVIHGIELRGRTHPEEVLPLLEQVQYETHKKVRQTIIHVLGQISYKNGCIHKVLTHLKNWNNRTLVSDALQEIVQVHKNYKFSNYSDQEVAKIIRHEFPEFC